MIIFVILPVLALVSLPVLSALDLAFSMFSDAPNSGAWLLPFVNSFVFFWIAWAALLIIFVFSLVFRKLENLSEKILKYLSAILGVLFLVTVFVITFSYRPIGGDFGKDYFHTYYGYTEIGGYVDQATFVVLGSSKYAKDDRHAYYANAYATNPQDMMEIIPGADLSTFRSIGKGFAEDKNNIYFEGQELALDGLDEATFVPLNVYYAKDKNHAYYMSISNETTGAVETINVIPDADVQTFVAAANGTEDESVAKDKNATYVNNLYSFIVTPVKAGAGK